MIDTPAWSKLNAADKRALRAFAAFGPSCEPLARVPGVGERTINHLLEFGLVEKGPVWRLHGQTYRVTKQGMSLVSALEECGRNRPHSQ